ncbi:copper resistance CopC family protein [Gilvimarinus sp. F26214L]|uniref:copper resistance CopC family protein n=1 Tax=Gilvimarinus sp. DZF01 TaxID=3461371 RepID=UPI0040456B0B
MNFFRSFSLFLLIVVGLSACGGGAEPDSSRVFLKANPPVDGTLEYPPRTLRVFLTELPDVSRSELKLTGPQGEIPLTGLHTMGADDLMIEIEQYPLPNGEYTVEWKTRFAEGAEDYSGQYQFTVAAKQG